MNTYAAMAHKGKLKGKTFEVLADGLYPAKVEDARIAGVRDTNDVSVQLQRKADGTEVIGAIM